jgi:small multidrug resistance pump
MIHPLILKNPTFPIYHERYMQISMIDRPDIYLVSSILLETLSTCCLKNTLNNKIWFLPVYTGYGISFYTFPKSLNKYTLSIAYTIWCGGGIILTNIFDRIFYKEIITLKKIISTIFILFGVYLSS